MLRGHQRRVLAIGLCLLCLFGLFVLGGAGWPADPQSGPGIGIEDPDVSPDANPGAFVETSGIVVSTEPTVLEIETTDGGVDHLTLENAPPVEEGQILTVSGTLTETGTLAVQSQRAVTRAPWEIVYMYLISSLGVVLVVAVGIDSWRLNRRTLTVEPRDTPLHRTILDRRQS